MKKSIFSVLFVCLNILTAYSQDKGYIAVSLGPSFPSGDFGSKDLDNEAAGLANTGAIFDITYAQKFGKSLGMTILLRGQANSVDPDPLIDELYAQVPGVPWSASTGNWGMGGFMAGLYGSFPMGGEKVTFDTRAMIGYISATSPEITISGFADTQYFWVTTESATGEAFGFLIGAGVNFHIGQRLGLLLNFDFLGAKPEFLDVGTYTSLGTLTYDTYQQQFSTLNIGAGIAYRW